MVRVLRYPYLTGLTCLCAVSCAVARDLCVGAGLLGWARVLLICTFVLLGLCFSLLSCRFFVDELGVGVGFLLRVRRTAWHELASVGVLSCNSRRTYLYGLYTHSTGFQELLHRAPGCGSWGSSCRPAEGWSARCSISARRKSTLRPRRANTPSIPFARSGIRRRCICCCSFPAARWRFSPAP